MENVRITNLDNEKIKHMDLGDKVKENKEDIQIGERICVNLKSYLLLKEIITQMKLAHEVGDSQHWVITGVDGLSYRINNWHI